ncbi:MAG: mechanosensitive ion channel [Thermodesulfobacteriota bacterium]|nr:mechanosensitive ion channel [Thermodesulfobacteriota bacterium]
MEGLFEQWNPWASSGVLTGGSILLGIFVHILIFKTIERVSLSTHTVLDNSFIKHCRRPSMLIIPIIIIRVVLPLFTLPPLYLGFFKQVLSLAMIVSIAWLLIKITFVLEDLILSQYRVDVSDNLEARRIHTQIQFFKRAAVIVIGILTLAIILTTFDKLSQFGTSILASAGIIGIIVGFAAQRSIATLLAGLQIAVTQPIRIDDVVIVENEWGRIEEITLTYVVVKIWDQRRLVLPITYFIEKPFQNWTRTSAEILGTVFLYVDYTVPIESIREELGRILEGSTLWDRRVSVLHVTNATERTVELRALMSASDASNAWGLRCEVREKLIDFVQKNYPGSLPRLRTEIVEKEGNYDKKTGS